ncbi:MAG: CpsD/CapB family tyrosine-protein kinase [Lachnospiraceae bacterium]|nr:CpsD/CapB family tyrosine-protein kinase [Lachnospiraceae bacterium]
MKKTINLYRSKDQVVNDAFDRAIVNIYVKREKYGYKSFVLCGSEAGVGTTSIAVEMAIALSVAGWKTLLIDGDLRKDADYKRLNQEVEMGLTDYVQEQVSKESIIYETNWPSLEYIPCGLDETESPVRVLCSVKMEKLMAELKEKYDYIIIDTPSINSLVDGQIFATKADATMLVAAMNSSSKKNLAEAKKKFAAAGANVIGVIENMIEVDEYKKYIKDFDYFKKQKYVKKVKVQ